MPLAGKVRRSTGIPERIQPKIISRAGIPNFGEHGKILQITFHHN